MNCKNPYIKGSMAFGCGQCLPCRINRRRLWTHRIILEALKHEFNSFVTLTYAPEHYPVDGSLKPKHLQDFIKRVRNYFPSESVRYYAVGEYGDETERAHYHIAFFGVGPEHVDILTSCWTMGMLHVGTLTLESSQYVAGYVTKKLTDKDDERLKGRHPEFARMSNRPGIGAGALDELEDFLYTDTGAKLLLQTKDVPLFLRHGGKTLPLGRYLRTKLRERMAIPKPPVEANLENENAKEMSALFEASEARTRWQKLATYQKASKPRIRSIEGRYKIFNSRKKKL